MPKGCLWSHQSTCGVRMQQRRVQAHVSHTDAAFFFSYPSCFFQVSVLISLRTRFNTREWIFVWGQIWDIWNWIIDAFLPGLYNGFSQQKALFKILSNVRCHWYLSTGVVLAFLFWINVAMMLCWMVLKLC